MVLLLAGAVGLFDPSLLWNSIFSLFYHALAARHLTRRLLDRP